MKPLLVLVISSIVAGIILRLANGTFNYSLSARIGMSVMLLFTAIGHFAFTDGMALMIPDFIPFKREMVYLTGFIEVCGAMGLLLPSFQMITAWLLILFFLLILPANIKASLDHLDYQTASFNGHGLNYLWFRIPLQFLFIVWIYLSAIKLKLDWKEIE